MKTKLTESVKQAIVNSGLRSGMTISFHHHLRNGDYVLNMVLEAIAELGIGDLTVNASSLFDAHRPLKEHIKNGVVTTLQTDYMSRELGRFISAGGMKNPVQFRTHGGRPCDIENGKTPIDVAFIAAPASDAMGNCTGKIGKSACGSPGQSNSGPKIPAARWAMQFRTQNVQSMLLLSPTNCIPIRSSNGRSPKRMLIRSLRWSPSVTRTESFPEQQKSPAIPSVC